MINTIIAGSLPLMTDFPSRKHWEAAVWQIIIERIASIEEPVDLTEALNFLLSPKERKGITYRALAASRIYSGIGPSEISRELWLTRQTIGAIKKSLVEGEYRSARVRKNGKK